MRFFAKCESCNQRKFFINRRKYVTIHAGVIRNTSEICKDCENNIIHMLGDEIKK